ncbi:class I SAM-dependent methyltransferase [Thermodesulfobacteriota bacterium]
MRKDKPSRTAYKVGVNIISLGSKPGMEKILPLGIVEATEKILVGAGAASKTVVRMARSQWAVSMYEWFDWMMPGQFEAFAHRKAFCEHQIREVIRAGARQILVLGAGYDTLGWRLAPEFPEVNFFEIDHPATATPKAKGIEALGRRDNLHLISEDLGQRKMVDVLEAHNKWDKSAPAVIVAEGLLQYLPAEAVRELFLQAAVITGPGSRIVFTFTATGGDGRPDAGKWTGLVLWIMRSSGEPWLWSIRPEELPGFLHGTGWTYFPEIEGAGKHGVEYFGVATR